MNQDEFLEHLLDNNVQEIELHPMQQAVYDHPELYVTVRRDQWNKTVEMAGQAYRLLHAPKTSQDVWFVCRYGHGCKAQYKNSPSNRTRHEKQAHGYTHKENGHES